MPLLARRTCECHDLSLNKNHQTSSKIIRFWDGDDLNLFLRNFSGDCWQPLACSNSSMAGAWMAAIMAASAKSAPCCREMATVLMKGLHLKNPVLKPITSSKFQEVPPNFGQAFFRKCLFCKSFFGVSEILNIIWI